MNPHPRIRKTAKWSGAAATALLFVVWILSIRWSVWWWNGPGECRAIAMGCAIAGSQNYPVQPDRAGLSFDTTKLADCKWWFWTAAHNAPGVWQIFVPLWIPASLAALATWLAWRADANARRSKLGLCPTPGCYYDRTGLPPTSLCPECGKPPT